MSTYEISKSSLLSLKAEILRKQGELAKAKLENNVKIRNLKKNSPLDLKNKGVERRQQTQDNSEEEDLLKKSRETLEAKSRLYDKLSKNTKKLTPKEAEYYKRYLVRFDNKCSGDDREDDFDPDEDVIEENYEPPKNPDEEWVEYVDCLGRTRTCLRKDLEYLKKKDEDLQLIVDSKERNRAESRTRSPPPPPQPPKPKTPEPQESEENELMSSDMRREILRKQWEKEEEELRNKSDIHYQDILFNEARTHGVGYYSFSKDEEVRAKQQEALKKLREETKQQQKKSQELKAMREKQLAARIRAATNRKREREGLPPLTDEEFEAMNKPAPEAKEPSPEKEEENPEVEEKRKKHVRPWDMGKEGVREHYEHTQEEWVEKKRKERHSEFAPPSAYHRRRNRSEERKPDKDRGKGEKRRGFRAEPIIDSDEEPDNLMSDYKQINKSKSKGAEIAPPPTYDYYGPSHSKKHRRNPESSNVTDSIEAGLKFLREQMEKKEHTSKKRNEDIFAP